MEAAAQHHGRPWIGRVAQVELEHPPVLSSVVSPSFSRVTEELLCHNFLKIDGLQEALPKECDVLVKGLLTTQKSPNPFPGCEGELIEKLAGKGSEKASRTPLHKGFRQGAPPTRKKELSQNSLTAVTVAKVTGLTHHDRTAPECFGSIHQRFNPGSTERRPVELLGQLKRTLKLAERRQVAGTDELRLQKWQFLGKLSHRSTLVLNSLYRTVQESSSWGGDGAESNNRNVSGGTGHPSGIKTTTQVNGCLTLFGVDTPRNGSLPVVSEALKALRLCQGISASPNFRLPSRQQCNSPVLKYQHLVRRKSLYPYKDRFFGIEVDEGGRLAQAWEIDFSFHARMAKQPGGSG